MPRFHGYICPRTKKLFEHKERYVVHLRKLARESRRKKLVVKAVVPLRESFDLLRLGATSQNEILPWLENNRTAIIRLACIINPTLDVDKALSSKGKLKPDASAKWSLSNLEVGAEAKGESRVKLPKQRVDIRLMAQGVKLYPATPKSTAFVDMAVSVLQEIPGVSAHKLNGQYSLLYLFAEDWPCIAANALYEQRHFLDEPNVQYAIARILEKRYPAVSFEMYKGLCEGAMLAGDAPLWDAAAFSSWLKRSGDVPLNLPAIEMTGPGTNF